MFRHRSNISQGTTESPVGEQQKVADVRPNWTHFWSNPRRGTAHPTSTHKWPPKFARRPQHEAPVAQVAQQKCPGLSKRFPGTTTWCPGASKGAPQHSAHERTHHLLLYVSSTRCAHVTSHTTRPTYMYMNMFCLSVCLFVCLFFAYMPQISK